VPSLGTKDSVTNLQKGVTPMLEVAKEKESITHFYIKRKREPIITLVLKYVLLISMYLSWCLYAFAV